MGGGKGSTSNPSSDAAAQISQQMFNQTDPLRQNVLGQLNQFSQGGYDPSKSPLFAPSFASAKSGIEGQYGLAKQNILEGTARGGGQTQALAGLETSRASQMGQVPGQISQNIISDMMNKAYGTAFNTPQQSVAGLNAAGQTSASMYGSNQALQGSQYQALGGLGSGLGMAWALK